MKYTGQGGTVLIDGTVILQLTGWELSESSGDIMGANSAQTTGSLGYFFDPLDPSHRILLGSTVKIEITPSVGANILLVEDCFINGFTVAASTNSINTASLSFTSHGGIL